MFEVYENWQSQSDRYMVIIENPDRDLEGHKPFYDISISSDGGIAHGSQWSQREVEQLQQRASRVDEMTGASYAFRRIKASEMYPQAQRALLNELETDNVITGDER